MTLEERSDIRFGVQTWSTDVAALRRYWRAADALRFDLVAYGDGLGAWTHDGWVMLGLLAGVTERVRIGPAVTYAFSAAAHHPAWLAKRAVAVDHASGGRLDLRLAIGPEDGGTRAHWAAFGIAYPPARERLARLADAVGVVRALWGGEPVDHAGPSATLHAAQLLPRPVQQPGPPIWVAAVRPRAIAMAARHADGWEASYLSPEAFAGCAARLDDALARAGRPPQRVRRSLECDVVLASTPAGVATARQRFLAQRGIGPDHPLLRTALVGTPAAVAGQIARYAAAGATDLLLGFSDFPATDMLERFAAEVRPAVREAARAGQNV